MSNILRAPVSTRTNVCINTIRTSVSDPRCGRLVHDLKNLQRVNAAFRLVRNIPAMILKSSHCFFSVSDLGLIRTVAIVGAGENPRCSRLKIEAKVTELLGTVIQAATATDADVVVNEDTRDEPSELWRWKLHKSCLLCLLRSALLLF